MTGPKKTIPPTKQPKPVKQIPPGKGGGGKKTLPWGPKKNPLPVGLAPDPKPGSPNPTPMPVPGPPAPGKATFALVLVLALASCGTKAVEVPGPPVPTLPACQTEDDPGPCLWDAASQGNGRGKSFIRYRGKTYVEERS